MFTFHILDGNDEAELALWRERWHSWPMREVFAHPAYIRLFSSRSHQPACAIGTGKHGSLILPFSLRSIASEPWAPSDCTARDVIGPYGYGGAFKCGNVTPDEEASFWASYRDWAHASQVVASFFRLSLFPSEISTPPWTVMTLSQNVVRSLRIDYDSLWRDYEHKVRKNVKAARRSGLSVVVDETGENLPQFIRVYHDTMRRRHVDSGYYFSDAFFQDIVAHLAGSFAFFHVLSGATIVSTELVLVSTDKVYSFLGGTLADAYAQRPNDLLKHAVNEWGMRNGKRFFVLGGGYEPDDGIFRYKKSFAPHGMVPFRVAQEVHDTGLMERLTQARKTYESQAGGEWEPSGGFFPPYREEP